MPKLSAAEIKAASAEIPDWSKKGSAISRTYEFEDFAEAVKFVTAVAERAEKAQHHPDIDIRWNKVTLTLTTHDASGLTEKDFAMAKQFDAI
jgi:4a-hydroxytetrahydrobiopterin dehydratase